MSAVAKKIDISPAKRLNETRRLRAMKLIAALRKADKTVQDIVQALGVSHSIGFLWKRGVVAPNVESLRALEAYATKCKIKVR
jgi:hypothetical protein